MSASFTSNTWNAPPVPINSRRNVTESTTANNSTIDTLRVVGTATIRNLHVTNDLEVGGTTTTNGPCLFRSHVSMLSSATIQGTLSVGSNVYFLSNAYVGNNLSITNQTNTYNLVVGNHTTTTTLSVLSNAYVGNHTTTTTLSVLSNAYVGNHTTTTTLSVLSNAYVTNNLSVGGEVYTNGRIRTSHGYVDPEVGDIKMNVSPIERNGWLRCDGRAISRSAYANLFAIIGTTFGIGDNFTTFNLPNTYDRVLGNSGSSHSNGQSVGSESITLTTTNLPSHTHSGTVDSNGTHTHSINDPGHAHTQTTINDDFNSSGTNPPGFTADSAGTRTWSNINTSTTGITINSNGDHTHTFTTNGGNGVGSTPFSVIQPTLFIGYTFIFAG